MIQPQVLTAIRVVILLSLSIAVIAPPKATKESTTSKPAASACPDGNKKEILCQNPSGGDNVAPSDPARKWNKDAQSDVDCAVQLMYPNWKNGHCRNHAMVQTLNGYNLDIIGFVLIERGIGGMSACFDSTGCWATFTQVVKDVAWQFYMSNYVATKDDEFTKMVKKALLKQYNARIL